MEVENPWKFNSTQEYLYFCCVECEFKDKNEELFLNHVQSSHFMGRNVFAIQNQVRL